MKVIEKYLVTFCGEAILILNVKPCGMLKPRRLLTYFGHNSFCFLSFQNSRQICSGGQGGGEQGGGRQGGGRQ